MAYATTRFKLIDHYGDPTLMEEVEVNLKHWLDWSFLEIGAWTEVSSGDSGTYGGPSSVLYPLKDPSYHETDYSNKIYAGIRKDWIYESGVGYVSPPLLIDEITFDSIYNEFKITLEPGSEHTLSAGDTITVLGNSLATGEHEVSTVLDGENFLIITDVENLSSGTGEMSLSSEDDFFLDMEDGSGILGIENFISDISGVEGGSILSYHDPMTPKIFVNEDEYPTQWYEIDYPNGKIIFDYDMDIADTVVTANYSYRNVQVYVDGYTPHNFEVQKNSLDPSAFDVTTVNEGNNPPDFTQDPSQRMQLPAVIIEAVQSRTSEGYMLGSGGLRCFQDVLFTVVAQNKYECKIISDILANQKHKTIPLYDIDVVASKNLLPLTHEGYKNLSGLQYKEIIENEEYLWSYAFIKDAYLNTVETNSPDMYMCKVRYQLEVIKL